mgnify:CR=1 FL=1
MFKATNVIALLDSRTLGKMSELFRLVIEKRDAEGMDKFIKIIQDHGWKIVLSPSDVQTSLAEFTMHASESHILHSLHLIFAHKE